MEIAFEIESALDQATLESMLRKHPWPFVTKYDTSHESLAEVESRYRNPFRDA
jgi:hypothetical protein